MSRPRMPDVPDVEMAVVAALRSVNQDPSTENYRTAAQKIIALRKLHKHQDMQDWTGRSLEYRSRIERLYREADMPPDSGSSIQANLRYHLGNDLRKVAPPDQLKALGLAPRGPLDRVRETRRDSPTRESVQRRLGLVTGEPTPETLAKVALNAVRQLRKLETSDNGVRATLLKLLSETGAALTELP